MSSGHELSAEGGCACGAVRYGDTRLSTYVRRCHLQSPAILAIFLLALTAPGCKKEINPDYRVPPPLVDPLPMTVGVFYDEEFRNYLLETERDYAADITVSFGRASVSFHDDLFSKVFAKIVPLQARVQSLQGIEPIDLVIETKILSSDFWLLNLKNAVDISYSYTLYSPAGDQLADWKVDGPPVFASNLDEAFENAMRDAGARFIVMIYEDPSIHRCLSGYLAADGNRRSIEECFTEQ